MYPFQGKFMRDGQVIADNVSGRFDVKQGLKGEVLWSGYGSVAGAGTLQLGDVLDLVLADGRSSKVSIDRINQTPAGVGVSFATVR